MNYFYLFLELKKIQCLCKRRKNSGTKLNYYRQFKYVFILMNYLYFA